jgi:hypothetical protein
LFLKVDGNTLILAVRGTANGQDGTATSNGANGGISINGNVPAVSDSNK